MTTKKTKTKNHGKKMGITRPRPDGGVIKMLRNMNTVLMYVIMCLVCRFKVPGGSFRNLKFDLLYKCIYRHAASRTSNFRPAWDFTKINTLNLVPLTKESRFPKEQSL